MKNSSKSLSYRLYTEDFGMENYFRISDDKKSLLLVYLETWIITFPLKGGRWQNISRENRKCHLSKSGNIGDEFHYLFKCTWFDSDRNILLANKFVKRPNNIKFKALMISSSPSVLNNLWTLTMYMYVTNYKVRCCLQGSSLNLCI